MIRNFHLADRFTLGNAACGAGGLFAVMIGRTLRITKP